MNQFKNNILSSFSLVKKDVQKLNQEIVLLKSTQEKLLSIIEKLKSNELKLYHKIEDLESKSLIVTKKNSKTKSIKKEVFYIASKRGKKFHIEKCPYAHNIRPKSKIIFKTGTEALNKGYKPCECVR